MKTLAQIQDALRTEESVILDLTDVEIDSLSARDIELLQAEFGSRTLMKLPPREREFMSWLKQEDPDIYDDLWEDDEELLVSLSYLPAMQKGGSGFAICELAFHDNYYFTKRHFKQPGLEAVPGILERAEKGEELSIGEVLMFDILRAPTDIWHFCHRYGVPLAKGRAVVHELVTHEWLVHLTRSEDLAGYLED